MILRQKTFLVCASALAASCFFNASVFAQTSSANPPVISGLVVDNITQSSAIISWNTDVPATTRLDYGPTANYEISPIIDSSLRTFHQIQISPLDTDTTYHYRARSTAASGRERVDTDHTFATKPPLDYRPPDAITSLHVASATVTSLVLIWAAPGGDGPVGTSSSYEIRASSKTIPEIGALQWWNGADILANSIIPLGPGSKESYVARDLATSTTYYFAVRARDKAGNISPISISDIRSGSTLAPPVVIVPPATIATSTATSTSLTANASATTSATTTPGALAAPASPLISPPVTPRVTPAALLTGNLSYGMRSESVKTLQRILIAQGLLAAGSDSGFFGSLTQRAVRKFQCARKIVCFGSARTTGYGMVGAKTRTKLNEIAR